MKATFSGTLDGGTCSGITSLQFSVDTRRDEVTLKAMLEYYNTLNQTEDSGHDRDAGWISLAEFAGSDFSNVMLVFGEPLTESEIREASGCLGYALREVLAGEDLSDPEVRESSLCVHLTYYYDSTKSRRDDPDYFAAFEKAKRYIKEGTPIRKTNRAGSGTKGTRLVDGIGAINFDIFVR